jgi:hypothetical protein
MSFSMADVLAEACDALNAAALTDADLTFWTVDQLYEFADEAAERMARTAAVFVARDSGNTLATANAVYPAPERHVAVIRLTVAGVALIPSSSRELEALSDDWTNDAGTPARWIADWQGHDQVRVHPTPAAADDGKTLEILLAHYPAAITADSPTVAAPRVFGDYLAARVVAEARRREGDGGLPEVADALDREADLYEQIARSYWGRP